LFLDDFEVLAMRRGVDGAGGDSSVAGRVLSTFLTELDGVAASSGTAAATASNGGSGAEEGAGDEEEEDSRVLVVAAVPALELLDEALIRPGRLSLHIHLDYPSLDDAEAVMRACLGGCPLEPALLEEGEEGMRAVARALLESKCGTGSSRGRLATVSDVVQLCHEGVQGGIREQVATAAAAAAGGGEGSMLLAQAQVTRQHLMATLHAAATPPVVKSSSAPFVFTPLN
jgi:SpoVK/Ycf46/Vps4 family AAA+-type ATPase